MIASVSEKPYKEIKALPYSMQIVAATGDKVEDSAKMVCKGMVKDGIGDEQKEMLSELSKIPMDTMLTTNYSYEIEQAVTGKVGEIKRNSWAHSTSEKKTEESKWLQRYSLVTDADGYEHTIWHIHGEATAPNYMVMGHYYYGKLIGYISDYLPKFLRRYRNAMKNGKEYKKVSWVDYFLLDDVYMFGLGMDPSESDLWYLLSVKKRRFPETKVYFFTPDDRRDDILMMLSTYGVEIIETSLSNEKGKYKKYYHETIDVLKEYMTQ